VHGRFRWAAPLVVAAGVLAVIAPVAANAAEPVALPLDTATTVDGIEVACTGIGQTRDDPRWTAYSVRIEFSDAKSEYLADASVSLTDSAGQPLLAVTCDGPWVLLKLKEGVYKVQASLTGSTAKPRSAAVKPPPKGQIRVVLQFPDA